jgi:hypothetical protein
MEDAQRARGIGPRDGKQSAAPGSSALGPSPSRPPPSFGHERFKLARVRLAGPPLSLSVRELVRHILAAAPELDDTTAVQIARRAEERERPVSARDVANHLGLRKTDCVYANANGSAAGVFGEGK